MPATPEQLREARERRKKFAEKREQETVTFVCPKEQGCRVTVYTRAKAWCRHGTMKEEKHEQS